MLIGNCFTSSVVLNNNDSLTTTSTHYFFYFPENFRENLIAYVSYRSKTSTTLY